METDLQMDSYNHSLKDYGSHYLVSLQFEDTLYIVSLKLKEDVTMQYKSAMCVSLCIGLGNADIPSSSFLYLYPGCMWWVSRDCFFPLLSSARILVDAGYPCMSLF